MDVNRKWLNWHEAKVFAEHGILAPPEASLPKGFALSLGGVPVAPLPKAGFAFDNEVHQRRVKHRLWLDSKYWSRSPYWATYFAEEREAALNRFTGEEPPPDKNKEERRRFWSEPGRTIRGVYEAALAEDAAAEAAKAALEGRTERAEKPP